VHASRKQSSSIHVVVDIRLEVVSGPSALFFSPQYPSYQSKPSGIPHSSRRIFDTAQAEMSLRPSPSTSPSPAPSSNPPPNLKPINTRASLQSQAIPRVPSGQQQNPISPRPPGINTGHGRPTSELLSGSNGMFQTPECKPQNPVTPAASQFIRFAGTAEAIDQWFENLQNYETTLVGPALC
jgi:hypothetical protein